MGVGQSGQTSRNFFFLLERNGRRKPKFVKENSKDSSVFLWVVMDRMLERGNILEDLVS